MIRPLRQRHRVMVLALTVTLPAAFAVGIATRREVPVSSVQNFVLLGQARHQSVLWTRDDLWERRPIHTRLLSVGSAPGQLAIELRPMDLIIRPDLLVYWVPGERNFHESVPDDAFLLGSFEQSSPSPLPLPEAASKQTGVLVLYSLADHEIEAVSRSFALKR